MKDESATHDDDLEMLRLPGVMKRCGLSKAAVYKLEAQGLFPRRVKLTSRASAWLSREITSWLKQRVELSRGELNV